MSFNFQCGDRPLDGFAIKRGVGAGGFGEVYLAISDGGKVVALKWIRRSNDRDVERRGAAAVLNLKHPNLINLYDLRVDARDDSWVVMEYMFGETLAALIARHQRGLPLPLVRECFVSIARAISHLHEHGIVHRDLKPGNVFIENSLIKVGDYGLSKAIGAGLNRGHTERIGTCQYMAPEVSSGSYDKKVDIYALGVILYEMLCGRRPYDGEDLMEVLRRQMQSSPDWSRVTDARFHPILARAMAQDRNNRHENVGELLADFEKLFEPVQMPVQAPVAPAPVIASEPPEVSLRRKFPFVTQAVFGFLASLAYVVAVLSAGLLPSDAFVVTTMAGVTAILSCLVLLFARNKLYRRLSELAKRAIMMGVGLLGALLLIFLVPAGFAHDYQAFPFWHKLWQDALGLYMAAMVMPAWWKILGNRRAMRVDALATLKYVGWVVLVGMALGIQWKIAVPLFGAILISQLIAPWKKSRT